jgi:hypothetical protein
MNLYPQITQITQITQMKISSLRGFPPPKAVRVGFVSA